MDRDVLIAEVFQRKPLWDQKDCQHHNRFILDKNWDEVAALMKTTREAVRVKWKSLRDNFRKELGKKPRSRSGEEGSQAIWKPKWKYFDSLLFLQDQFIARSSGGSLPEVDTQIAQVRFMDIQWTYICVHWYMGTDSSETTAYPLDIEMASGNNSDADPHDASRGSSAGSATTSGKGKRSYDQIGPRDDSFGNRAGSATTSPKRKRSYDQIGNALIRLEEEKLDMVTQSRQVDDDESFFNSLLPYVRRLPQEDKLLLRIQMQQLVYNAVYGKSRTGRNPSTSNSRQTFDSSSSSTSRPNVSNLPSTSTSRQNLLDLPPVGSIIRGGYSDDDDDFKNL
uniref:Uncharacterized protein LOC114336119 n=1 Tax=Diabrotica virgifera virgifera TaxID=50390 RepID=A0A6P7G5F7_DIAVI